MVAANPNVKIKLAQPQVGEDVWDALLGLHRPSLAVAHAGIVDHRVETAELVDLLGD